MKTNLLSDFLKNYDFDASSKAWRENKIEFGQGSFKYVCGYIRKNGEKCKNKRYRDYTKCWLHKNR